MSNTTKRVFDSVEELEKLTGLKFKAPFKHFPSSCEIVGFKIDDPMFYVFFPKESDVKYCDDYIYLRVTKENRPVFTPERLLGVETTAGYIKDVNFTKGFNTEITTIQLNNGHWYCPPSLNFYISDDFDETISLDEYIKLFYNVDNSL